MKKLKRLYLITFTATVSICYLTSCGSESNQMSDSAIERAAAKRFKAVRDTLSIQYNKDCDSLFQERVQEKVDSIVFEYYKNSDTLRVDSL
ncbi:MAG: hypothetical protein ACPG19_08970 [Saprospiraceae bacterium]